MRAIVTSIGESTTELCIWALERNGFDVTTVESDLSLWGKLKLIYNMVDVDFVRVDADTIVNKNLTPGSVNEIIDQNPEAWWFQFLTYDWYKQDTTHGGIQVIRKEALPALRSSVDRFVNQDRPETQLSRIEEFYNPRRFHTIDLLMGITNYKNDMKRVMRVKANRGQTDNYDFELAKRMDEL